MMDAPRDAVRPRLTLLDVLAIAVPITLSNATTPLVGLVDTAVIGRLGDAALIGGVAVAASMFGSQGGLKPGDVIYALNGAPISSVEALRSALSAIKAGDAAILQIERDARLMFLEVELG